MRDFLIVDVETSSIEEGKVPHVVEVAAVRWSLDHLAVREVLSSVVASPEPPHPVTGIPPALLEGAPTLDEVMGDVVGLSQGCEAVLAHNAEFDRRCLGHYLPLPWVCTYRRVRWPRGHSGSRVVDLAISHGVPIGKLHRALDDCLLVAALLERAHEYLPNGIGEVLSRAQGPLYRVEALVPYPGTEAKQAGFTWDPAPAKVWYTFRFEDELRALSTLPFRTRVRGSTLPPVGAA